MMQRFKQPNMDLHPDGEWIRYADHVEAMKRIAGAPVAQGLDIDALVDGSLAITDGPRHPFSKGGAVWAEREEVVRYVLAQAAPSAGARLAQGCARSHPHENMSAECHQKTVEARAANASAQQALESLCQWLLHRFGPDSPEGNEASSRLAAPAPASPAALTDAQVIARAEQAGFKWLPPDEEEGGFPGGFDMSDIDNMRKLLAASPAEGKNAVTEEMVSRFLGWRLPNDFAPDCGISFTPVRHYTGEIVSWPVGTNLLTAIQARQMLEHVLAAPSASDTMVYYGGGETPISFEDSASPAALTAKQRYDECMREGEEPSAVERLRFFCSLAMSGQDWLDVERFFDALPAASPADQVEDAKRLNALGDESWDLRCFSIGDDDIGWRVIEHHMAAPHERVVAEVFKDDPRAAIDAAMSSSKEGA